MNNNKKKILVLGSSGFLGSNICLALRKQFKIFATINKNDFYLRGIHKVYLKESIFQSIGQIIADIKPNLIINCIGFTDIDNENNQKNKLDLLNFKIPNLISKISKKNNIKLIHISTDQLYQDSKKLNQEIDQVNPVNLYGKIKLKAEKKVLSNDKNAIVVRTNFFGCNRLNKKSFFNFIYNNLNNNKKIFLLEDIYFTPVYIKDLIEILIKLYRIDFKGVINISSNSSISKYDFAKIIAEKFNLNSKLIIKSNLNKKNIFKVKRSKNMSLKNKKLKKFLNNLDLNIDKSVQKFKDDFSNGFFNEITNHMNYSRHYIPKSTINRLSNVIKYENLTQGKQILEFENKFSEKVGSKFAVAVSSCTAGLHISATALGLSNKNTLLTSPNTFVSSANVAHYLGSNLIFADIDADTPNINITNSLKIMENKKNKIKVFMPVHYSGIPVDLVKFQKFRDGKTFIIEDAAHALGSEYQCGAKVGSCKYSDVTVFSFHPVKSITTGEGGMITTNDKDIYHKLLMLRTHGINQQPKKNIEINNQYTNGVINPWYFEMQHLGYHYRITDIQAAIGIEQLKYLEKFIEKRKKLSFKYIEYFKHTPIETYDKDLIKNSSCHLFNIRFDFEKYKINKARLINNLKDKGIGCQVHYIPVPLHPYYKQKGFRIKNYPNVKKFYQDVLSIPLFYKMTIDQQIFVKENIIKELK